MIGFRYDTEAQAKQQFSVSIVNLYEAGSRLLSGTYKWKEISRPRGSSIKTIFIHFAKGFPLGAKNAEDSHLGLHRLYPRRSCNEI